MNLALEYIDLRRNIYTLLSFKDTTLSPKVMFEITSKKLHLNSH